MTTFSGRTDEASSPILGAGCFKKGTTLNGKVINAFKTNVGICYSIELSRPLSVNRAYTNPKGKGTENLSRVSIGALKGFHMALQAAGCEELKPNDQVQIVCTGTERTEKGNDQVNFSVTIERL